MVTNNEVSSFEIQKYESWRKRRGKHFDDPEMETAAREAAIEECMKQGGVSYPLLDSLWPTIEAALAKFSANEQQAADEATARAALTQFGGFRYPPSEGNVSQAIAVCRAANKQVTAENIRELWPKIQARLQVAPVYLQTRRELEKLHPDRKIAEAHWSELENAVAADGSEFTVEALEDVLHQGHPNHVSLPLTAQAQQAQADAAEAERIRQELRARLLDENGRPKKTLGNDFKSPAQAYREEISRIDGLSLDELRQIKAKRDSYNQLNSLSKEELRSVVKQQGDEQRQLLYASRYAQIPPKYIPPGKTEAEAVLWSPLLLKRLPSWETERLQRIYGIEQLNAAVAAGRNQ